MPIFLAVGHAHAERHCETDAAASADFEAAGAVLARRYPQHIAAARLVADAENVLILCKITNDREETKESAPRFSNS